MQISSCFPIPWEITVNKTQKKKSIHLLGNERKKEIAFKRTIYTVDKIRFISHCNTWHMPWHVVVDDGHSNIFQYKCQSLNICYRMTPKRNEKSVESCEQLTVFVPALEFTVHENHWTAHNGYCYIHIELWFFIANNFFPISWVNVK